MSDDEIDLRPDVDEDDLDRAVMASTIVLNAIPTIGSTIAEAVKHAIPNQRIDRMAHMLKILDDHVRGLQKDVLEQRMQTEEFRDLLEGGLWQTTRALSEERRAYIASLLKNSITSDELAHEQEKMLLSLLGQLKDAELIILGWCGTNMVGEEADAYFFRHEAVLEPPSIETIPSEEKLRKATLAQTFRDHLLRLGLTRMNDKGTDYRITPLGRMLLQSIDFYELEPAD